MTYVLLQMVAVAGRMNILTWDLDQKIKTSPTIRNSSSASGSGHVNHLALCQINAFCCKSDCSWSDSGSHLNMLMVRTYLYLLLST